VLNHISGAGGYREGKGDIGAGKERVSRKNCGQTKRGAFTKVNVKRNTTTARLISSSLDLIDWFYGIVHTSLLPHFKNRGS
jgi:hypothetical protein